MNYDEAYRIVTTKIEHDEKIGLAAGESGHSAFVSYKINSMQVRNNIDNKTQIDYVYTLYIESEFTIYPDNPPREYHYRKSILINSKNEIIAENDQR